MKKIICFSLWGDNYRYTGGALQNVDLAKIYYPDWICRFYVGKTTPEKCINLLEQSSNVEIIRVDDVCNWTGMFWRFLAASDPSIDVMITRDADSRLTKREKFAVDEWIKSSYQFHIIRDHQFHSVPILGGLWGAKKGLLENIKELIDKYDKGNHLGVDQEFLAKHIYPFVKNQALVHDEFFENKPFPDESGKRSNEHFVGQAYDGDGSILDVKQYGKIFIQDYLSYEKINLKTYDNPL
jgi:hypothetical protein